VIYKKTRIKSDTVSTNNFFSKPPPEVLCEYSKFPTTQQEYQDVQALLDMADQPGKKSSNTFFVSNHDIPFWGGGRVRDSVTKYQMGRRLANFEPFNGPKIK